LIRNIIISIAFCTLVFSYDTSNRNVNCMTQAIYHEARGESYMGKIAVGHIILNRIKKGYGTDPCEIVSSKRQFSWYGKNNSIKERDRWDECYRLSKKILANETQDPTKGSIFFHEKSINPGWKYKRIVVIDSHIFYK
jgi:N-acetylmuramoyl-L-alanine amidase